MNEPNLVQNTDNVYDSAVALQKVTRAYESSKRAQQDAFVLFRDMYRLWRFYKSKDSWVKIFNPIGFAITIGLLSKMFVKIPKILVNSKGSVYQNLAKVIGKLLEYQMDNPQADDSMEEEYIAFITELLVCGTAVGKVGWERRIGIQFEEVQTVDEFGQPTTQRQKTPYIAFNDPIFEYIPIQSFYIEPGAKSIASAKYVIYEKYCSKEYLLEKQAMGYYQNVDQIGSASNKSDQTGIDSAKGTGAKGNTTEKYKDKIRLLEYWEDDRLIVVANESTVLKDEDNPYNHGKKPFISMQYVKVPGEFYGIGALEPINDLHKAANVSLTQRIEYVSNLLTQQYAVLTNRGVDEDAIIDGYPIVHMESADAVTPLNKGAIQQAAFISGDEILAEIERGTGFSGYSGGTTNAAQDKTQGTATGISILTQEAQTRFDLTLKRFEKIVLKKIAYMFLDLDKQHFSEIVSEEEKNRMLEINGMQIMVGKDLLIAADWQVEIVPGSVGFIDKQQKLKNFLEWVSFANSMIPNFNRTLAVMEAAEYQEIEEPDRFIVPMDVLGGINGQEQVGEAGVPTGNDQYSGMEYSQGMAGQQGATGY